jgi:hypothetical protein
VRVLIDECAPRQLKSWLAEAHDVTTVFDAGWSGMKNGALLREANQRFDVLITADQNLYHQQSFAGLTPYAVVDPPAPESAADDGKSRLRVPNIYEVHSADWPRHEFTEASVGRAYESDDDYSIAVNMDNRHVRRRLTTIDY